MRIAGCDPGMKGALVLLADDERPAVLRMPVGDTGKEVDGRALAAWLLAEEVDLVILERVQARNTFNTAGKAIRKTGNEFRFATGYGVIQGVMQACGIRYRRVQPMTWKSKVLGGLGSDKDAAITYCQTRLPDVDLTPGQCRTPQDGIADAACLAQYGRMTELKP